MSYLSVHEIKIQCNGILFNHVSYFLERSVCNWSGRNADCQKMTSTGVFHLDMPEAPSYDDSEENSHDYCSTNGGVEVRCLILKLVL